MRAPKGNKRNAERRKEKSRDAARCRRSKETEIFSDLATALPLSKNVINQLDKASIIRVAISYLKIRAVLEAVPGVERSNSNNKLKIEVYNEDGLSGGHGDSKINEKPSYVLFENDINSLFMNALAGFLLVVSSEGDVIFISDNVQQYLGLSQVELLGQSIYELSHPCDHSEMKEILTSKENADSVDQKNIFVRMKCTLTNKGRNLNLKSANYKVIQYTGHVIKDNRTYPLAKEELVKSEQLNDSEDDESDDGSGGGSRDPEELSSGSETREKPSSPLSYFIAIGEPVPHPSDIQIPLGYSTFLSKHSLDMKFTYADDKINDFFGYNPESMMKKSVFDYHHAQDSLVIKQSFKNLFQKGQSQTQKYRFLALGGGYAWVLTQATLIYKDKSQKPHSVVCVNFVVSGIEEKGCIYSLCQLGDRSGTGCLKSLSAEKNPIRTSAKAAISNVTAAGVTVSVEVPEREPKIVSLLDGKKRKKTADCLSAINRSDNSPPKTNRPESRYREPLSETLTTRLHDLAVSPKIYPPFVSDKSSLPPPPISSVPLSATTVATAPSATVSALDTEPFPVPSVCSNVPKINLPAVTCLQSPTEKDDSGYCDTVADRSATKPFSEQIYRSSLNDNDSEAIKFKKDVTSVADEVVRRIVELNGDDDKADQSDSSASSSDFCKLLPLPSASPTFEELSHIRNLFDRPKQTTPKPNTLYCFAPITKDMNKGFLTFIDNDEDTGITTLKDEPEDLTHLAPTAGDVCVPLHATHENGGPLSYILPDMLEDIMLSDCNLLSARLNDVSDHELNSDHSPGSFFSYKDELEESCSRPISPRCEDDSNLPSLSSGDSPIYLRDSSINSLLDFGLVTSDDVKDLSSKASYEALSLDQDTLLPLITNDLMWGSSSTDSSNWSSLSNSPRSNCSLSPQLDYDSTSSLAKLLKEDQLPYSYDNRATNVINHSKGGYINNKNNNAASPSSFLNSTGRQQIHLQLRNEDKNEDIVHIRKRIRDDNDNTSTVSYNDNSNNRSAAVRRNSVTTQYARNNNNNTATMNNNNVVSLLKRRCTNYNARKGNVNNATNGLANNTVKLGDRKRSSNSALIGNKRAFNDTGTNNSANSNRSNISNGTGTGWKRSKQQQLNSATNGNRNGGEVGLSSSPSSYNSNDSSSHDAGGPGDGGGGGGGSGASSNKLMAAAMKNCVNGDRYKQTDSVLMNLLVSGCDLNAGYDDNAANNGSLLELNKEQQNVAPTFSCLSNNSAGSFVVSRDAVQRDRLKNTTVPSRWSAVNLLETDSSRIPSLMELTEQDYAVNAPSAGELLQGSDLLKALENSSLIC